MVGKNVGLMELSRNDRQYPDIFTAHCIIQRERFAAKLFKFKCVMNTVIQFKNLIGSGANKSPEIQKLG